MKKLNLSKWWRRRYVRIAVVLLLVFGGTVAFWFGLKAVLKSEYPLLAINASGMRPTLNFGDLVVVLGVSDASDVKTGKTGGDIIVFRKPSNPDEVLVQRAVNRTLVDSVWYIRTQEDNASSPYLATAGQDAKDTWGSGLFHEKFLIGKAVGKIPYLGYVLLGITAFLQTPEAMFFLFIALMFLVIFLRYPAWLKKKAKPQAKAL